MTGLDLSHVHAFVAVADAGSVSEAADQLSITQPALTRRLQKLQRDHEIQLLERRGPGLALTSAGRAFLPTARHLLREHDQAGHHLAYLRDGTLRELSVVAPGTTLIDIIIPFVATLGPNRPRTSVTEAALDLRIREAVETHDVVIFPAEPDDTVTSTELLNLPVWAHVASTHRWASRTEIELAELTEESLSVPTRNFAARRKLDAALELENLVLHQVQETNSGQVAQALVATGGGVAVVTDDPAFGLKPLRIIHRGQPLSMELCAMVKPDHYARREIAEFVHQLAVFCTQKYPSLD
ncbi:LysR family transcriptional regulator [Auritidibacter ignavus]|uniref:LysR family transcriptional regulator n=1 Tax=Auritidibacter ignavus TaxID=678932 RepID=UPI0024BB3D03|nr:LysR family transcriptional regulator [Auritidibacter ignavus]WHS29270.1 LysR family transcriptional regulator [Auritidibacter ignavus]